MPEAVQSRQETPKQVLLDLSAMTDCLDGDPGAADLVEKALSGEIAVTISTLTALRLWQTQVEDRHSEIRLVALLKLVNQLPVTEDYVRIARQIRSTTGYSLRSWEEAMLSINVAISQHLGLTVCSRDARIYQGHGCETIEY